MRIQYIDTTNKMRTIQVGGCRGRYRQEGGDSKLLSPRGKSSHYLDRIQFLWIDGDAYKYNIQSVQFNVDCGTILGQKPDVIAEMTIDNNGGSGEQSEIFEVNQTISNTSSFEHEHGFNIQAGTEFSAGFPCLMHSKISISAEQTNTFRWAKSNATHQSFKTTFTVTAPAHKVVKAQAVVTKAELSVPYKVILKNGIGETETSTGKWKGTSACNLHLKVSDQN